jgi:ketosteroid isomerase-like protein
MLYAKSSLSNAADQLQQACAARDSARVAALYGDQAVAMYPPPWPLPIVGRAANLAAWTSIFEPGDVSHPITVDEVVEAEQGDLGYTMGRWWFIQPSTGTHLGGRYVAVWQPSAGAWEITHLSANTHSDISAEEPPA